MGRMMEMRRVILTLTIVLSVALAPFSRAQSLTDGLVTKVDASAGKISIKHGPMKKLDMDEGMTMVYTARDPAMLQAVKAGDKVKFDAENVNGQFLVTKIQKKK